MFTGTFCDLFAGTACRFMSVAMTKRPTLHDVAQRAGVSHITVSRVVRGEQKVKVTTAERVRAAIAELGYKPDPHLSALAAYRSKNLQPSGGSVLAFLDCDGTEYSQRIFTGAQKEALAFGYSVERFELPLNRDQRQLSRMLFHRGVEGLLFGPTNEARQFERWEWDRVAPVSLGAISHSPLMHSVSMDYFHGLRLAFEQLVKQECRRVGLLLSRTLESRTGNFWLGAYHTVAANEIPPLLFAAPPTRKALRNWHATHQLDGVLTVHAEMHRELLSLGLKIAYLNEFSAVPGWGHVSIDPESIGAEGVRLIHHLLLRRELGLPKQPKTVLLRGQWADR
jgi:DNA-binding LacI/PurR family transcriptional regulator